MTPESIAELNEIKRAALKRDDLETVAKVNGIFCNEDLISEILSFSEAKDGKEVEK